jgi:hypothetical protein
MVGPFAPAPSEWPLASSPYDPPSRHPNLAPCSALFFAVG